MTIVSAEPILISENVQTGQVLPTLRLTYPRFIHAELMTHRALSRNAASSRAIPIKRMIERVMEDPAVPLHWGKAQKGMQASQETDALVSCPTFSGGCEDLTNVEAWLRARDFAVQMARAYDEAGYHKQVANRLLEPFAHITVVATATLPEWESVLWLRDHKDAEPHFQMLASEIKVALATARRQPVNIGEWHLPFVKADEGPLFERQVLSIARCAHTSYDTVDGYKMDYERAHRIVKDMTGADRLHASPFEHQARASEHALASNNFSGGWMQLRELVEDEMIWF